MIKPVDINFEWFYRTVLIIKPRRCTISQIYFWNRTLHVSDSFSVHHHESCTVHTAIGIFHTGYADCLLAVCTVLSDDGHRNCPKHVEFYSKNKFEKLVHLVCFITRTYNDARSSECQILFSYLYTNCIPVTNPLMKVTALSKRVGEE
jgi:hypothetical protein